MTDQITQILNRAASDGGAAIEALLPLVYDELRSLAASHLANERVGHTLQPTALVHEAYVRLVGTERAWKGRAHFFAAAATAMRRVLVDHARARKAAKRGDGGARVPIEVVDHAVPPRDQQVMELDEMLEALKRLDAVKSRVVEMRIFGGMTFEQIGEVLGMGKSTVADHWSVARAWLASRASVEDV